MPTILRIGSWKTGLTMQERGLTNTHTYSSPGRSSTLVRQVLTGLGTYTGAGIVPPVGRSWSRNQEQGWRLD